MSKTKSGVLVLGGIGLAVAAATGWQEMRNTDREIERQAETARELNAELLKLQKKEFENRLENIRLMR
jgi:hypothetical protein